MKKAIWPTLAVLIFLLLLWFFQTYLFLGGTIYSRSESNLILTGDTLPDISQLQKFNDLQNLDVRQIPLTAEQYEVLRAALPDCRILWSVPFQGSAYSQDTTDITVTTLSEADIPLLAYLPALQTLHAEGCTDYAALLSLKEARPGLDIRYTVTLGGAPYRENTTSLTLENADARELLATLPYLPHLTDVTFTGAMPTAEQVAELLRQRPDVAFHWSFAVCGVETSSAAEELILSDIPIDDISEVEKILPFFHQLKRVEMCNCGISNKDMEALSEKYPGTRFIWTVKIGRATVRTDITTFIPIKYGYSANATIRDPRQDAYNRLFDEDCENFKYCTDMICLDLGHMGITDYSFVANMPNLKYLILADTQGTDFTPIFGLENLVFLELFMTKFDQTELLPSLTNLRDLNLGFTTLSDTEPLKEMPWLERLWLPGTRLPSQTYKDLQAALPDTKVDHTGEHSTDNGWRRGYLYYEMRDVLGMYYLS